MTRPSSKNTQRRRAQELSNQGASDLRQGNVENAVSRLRQAYTLLPHDVAVAINLGGALIMCKQYTQAAEVLERALEQEPDNEMIWTNLGAAYLGNPLLAGDEAQQKAIAAFERAIALNPVAPNVHYNLALIHRDRGEIDRAMQRFRQAIQANPQDRDARRALERLSQHQDERDDKSAGPGD